jgi:predicted transcriptional regulator
MVATEPFSVRLTPAQLEKVARLARTEDRSQASVVRRAVDAFTDRDDLDHVETRSAAKEDR